jgi:hypothetical protein
MAAIPIATTTMPQPTRRRGAHRPLSRDWSHAPAVHDSVAPVTARLASAGVWWRTVAIVSVTYASAPKNANVSRPRHKMTAGRPGRALNVPRGSR